MGQKVVIQGIEGGRGQNIWRCQAKRECAELWNRHYFDVFYKLDGIESLGTQVNFLVEVLCEGLPSKELQW